MHAQVSVCAPKTHPFCGLLLFFSHACISFCVGILCVFTHKIHLLLDGCDLFNTLLLLCEILLFVTASLPEVTTPASLWVEGIIKTIGADFLAISVRLF